MITVILIAVVILFLGNPVNTVRIKHLIRMFPDAKFIYVQRPKRSVEINLSRHLIIRN